MKKVYRILALVVAAVMLFSASACSSGEEGAAASGASEAASDGGSSSAEEHEEVTLTIVHEHSEEAAATITSSAGFRLMLDEFKETHPWVTLEEQIIAATDVVAKYTALMAADELPDITYVKYSWLDTMVNDGMIYDLTEYANPDDYVDGLFSMTYNDKVYGLTNKYTIYNLVLYNEQLWKEAGYDSFPTKVDDLIAADDYFESQGLDTIALGNSGQWFANSYFVSSLLYDYCGDDWVEKMIAMDDSVNFTDGGFLQAYQKLADLSKIFNADCNMQDDSWAMAWYMQGKAAAHVVGGWGLATAEKMGEEYPEVWGNSRLAIFPSISGENQRLNASTPIGVGISTKVQEGAQFDAALEFCQTISSKAYAEYMVSVGSTAPVKIDVDYSGMGTVYEDFADILNGYETCLDLPTYLNQTVASALNAETQSVIAGTETPEQAAQVLQSAKEGAAS